MTQRANLQKLADYLSAIPENYEQFSMGTFYADDHGGHLPLDLVKKLDHVPCGTIACAVGHGPSAGIPIIDEDESWTSYAERALIPPNEPQRVYAFDWMFAGRWEYTDDTPQGAAKRIEYYLEHGLPDNFEEQMYGDDPLCY